MKVEGVAAHSIIIEICGAAAAPRASRQWARQRLAKKELLLALSDPATLTGGV